MSDLIIDPPSDHSGPPRLWQTAIPLAIALVAAVAGYYFLGHVQFERYGNTLAVLVGGCFVFFSAVFVILNREIAGLDDKAREIQIAMAAALRESTALSARADDRSDRDPSKD